MRTSRLPRTLGTFIALVGLVLTAAGLARAFTYSASAGTNTLPIQVGGVTGAYGHLSGGGTSPSSSASARYGYTCSGACCLAASQPFNSVPNILSVQTTWEPHNGGFTWTVEGTTSIGNKSGALSAGDDVSGNCGPAPVVSLTSMVTMTEAAAGSAGGATNMAYPDALTNTANYTTNSAPQAWNSGSGGTWADSDVDPTYMGWTVDPDDPDTLTFTCSSKVTTTFEGSAAEVVGVSANMGADCTLSVGIL